MFVFLGKLNPYFLPTLYSGVNTKHEEFFYPDGEVMFALEEDKVCRSMAQMLLQNAVKFNLSEFQDVWQQSVPEGMSTRLDQLSVSSFMIINIHLY